jgi:hypothetical protein
VTSTAATHAGSSVDPVAADDVDATLLAAIATIEELENVLRVIDREAVSKRLRDLLEVVESLPFLENDLRIFKHRLRQRLKNDPDKTPRPVSVTDLTAQRGEKK